MLRIKKIVVVDLWTDFAFEFHKFQSFRLSAGAMDELIAILSYGVLCNEKVSYKKSYFMRQSNDMSQVKEEKAL